MKKRIIAMILVLVLTLSVFSGCTLIEQDETKVMSQAVVTVGKGETAQTITMSDVITSYNQVAYFYTQYYGMSSDAVLDMVMSSLQSQKVFLYGAMQELPVVNASADNMYAKYLTAEEIAKAEAEVTQMIADEIDAAEVKALSDAFKAGEGEATVLADTTVPDWATTGTTVPVDFKGTVSRNQAYASFVKSLSSAGYTYDEMFDLMLNSSYQTALSAKFQDVIESEYSASVSDIVAKYNAQLADEIEYNNAYGAEKFMAKYDDGSVVIYNPSGEEYGYVKQILVNFTEEEKATLKDLEGDALIAKRLELAGATVATDMRDSWLYKYGYNTNEDGLFSRYDFNGTVTPELFEGVQTRDEEGNFAYSTVAPTEYVGYQAFLSGVVNPYLGGKVVSSANGFDIYSSSIDNEKLDDLMYAYNEDKGVMSKELGYFVPDKDFYEEFNVAAESLIGYGAGAYTVAVTDYGYHIIYLTKVVSAETQNAFVESHTKNHLI